MKKFLALVPVLIIFLLLFGCSGEPLSNTNLPNPIVDADAAGLAALGLPIDAPQNAQNISYSIISNQIAQVFFTADGVSYNYRAAKSEEDISGVYETFEDVHDVLIDGDGWTAAITVKMVKEADGGLAAWRFGDTSFSLFTSDPVSAEALSHTAMALAEKAYIDFSVS